MKFQFILNRCPNENGFIKMGFLHNPFPPPNRLKAELQSQWQKEAALWALENGVPTEHLKPMVLKAGMSEEVADLLLAHTQEGEHVQVTVDSETGLGLVFLDRDPSAESDTLEEHDADH